MPNKLTAIIHVLHTHCQGVRQCRPASVCLTSVLQTSGIGHISEINLCGDGSDVRDGFYQFSQFKIRAGNFGVTEVYDSEDGLIPVKPNDQVWPVEPCQWVGLGPSTSARTRWNTWYAWHWPRPREAPHDRRRTRLLRVCRTTSMCIAFPLRSAIVGMK